MTPAEFALAFIVLLIVLLEWDDRPRHRRS